MTELCKSLKIFYSKHEKKIRLKTAEQADKERHALNTDIQQIALN